MASTATHTRIRLTADCRPARSVRPTRWVAVGMLAALTLLTLPASSARAQEARKGLTAATDGNQDPLLWHSPAEAKRFDAWSVDQRRRFEDYRNSVFHTGPRLAARRGGSASGSVSGSASGSAQTAAGSSFAQVAPVPGFDGSQAITYHAPVQRSGGDVAVFFLEAGESSAALYMTATSDNGVTWSDRSVIANEVYGPVRAVALSSGRIVVSVGVETGIQVIYSDDDGSSWTSGRVFSFAFGHDMKLMSDGAVLMSYAVFNQGLGLVEYFSTNSTDGVSWSTSQLIVREDGSQTGFGIYDATIAAATGSALVFAMVTVDATGLHLDVITSSDGTNWSSRTAVVEAGNALNPIPTLAHADDGTVWLVYSDDNDLFFTTSDDGGASWTARVRWTNYSGLDYFPSATTVDGDPLVTFSAARGTANATVWIAGVEADADTDPIHLPPVVDIFADTPAKAGLPFVVNVQALDESGISNVAVTYTVDATTSDPIVAVDDGSGHDEIAGDDLWTAALSPMESGTTFTFTAIAEDTDGNTGFATSFEIGTIAAHTVGNIVMGMPGGSFSGIEYPAGSGDNYLFGGGLWIGAKPALQSARVAEEWMWTSDESVGAIVTSDISDEDITIGIRESDLPGIDPLGLRVTQRSYQWAQVQRKRAGEENGVVVAFDVTNTGAAAATVEDIRVGLYLDVDVLDDGGFEDDVVAFDSDNNILYMYDSGQACLGDPQISCTTGHIGVSLINDPTAAKVGDVAGTLPPATATCTAANPPAECPDRGAIGPFNTMGTGINSAFGGSSAMSPNDYRMLIVAPSFSLATDETKSVTFALALGDGLSDMVANMQSVAARFETAIVNVEDVASDDDLAGFTLTENYPNPFSGTTRLNLTVASPISVKVSVHDLLGREIAILLDETVSAGRRTIAWDASRQPSGVYLYRATIGKLERLGRMVVVR